MKSYNAFQLSGKKRHFSAIIMAVIAVEVVADIDLDLGWYLTFLVPVWGLLLSDFSHEMTAGAGPADENVQIESWQLKMTASANRIITANFTTILVAAMLK